MVIAQMMGRHFRYAANMSVPCLNLEEVFTAFPGNKFLINFQSNDADEGKAFAHFLTSNSDYKKQIWAVYGGAKPTAAVLEAHSDMKGYTKQSVKACLKILCRIGMERACSARVPTIRFWPFLAITPAGCGAGRGCSTSVWRMLVVSLFC